MKKRILGILTAMVLCLTLLPTAALAVPTAEGIVNSGDCYTAVLLPWNQSFSTDEKLNSRQVISDTQYLSDNGIYELWNDNTCAVQVQAYIEQGGNGTVYYKLGSYYTTNEIPSAVAPGIRFKLNVIDKTHITLRCIGYAEAATSTMYQIGKSDQWIEGMYLGWRKNSIFLSDTPEVLELTTPTSDGLNLKCVSTGESFNFFRLRFRKIQENLSAKKEQTFTYNGNVQLPVVSGRSNYPTYSSTSDIMYGMEGYADEKGNEYFSKNTAEKMSQFPKNPGTYQAYIYVKRTKYYEFSGPSGTNDFVFGPITVNIVAKAQITKDAAPVTGLVYNGQQQALVSAAEGTGGTVKYSLDKTTWSTDIPTAKNAGTYTVYYKVVGEAVNGVTISDSEPKSVSVTIAKQALAVNSGEVRLLTSDYTGKLQTARCLKNGEYGSTSKVIPADAITYSGSYQATAVGTYTATVQPSSNYTWKDGSTGLVSLEWRIASTPINLTGITAESRPYKAGNLNVNVTWAGTVQPLTFDDDAQDTLNNALKNGALVITVDPIGVMEDDAVGTNKKVRVKATMTGTNQEYLNGFWLNYIGGSDHQLWVFNCVDITKPKYTLIAPTAAEDLTYDGTEKALLTTGASCQESSTVSGITYSYKLGENGTWSSSFPTASAAGTYDVYYRANETTNYAETACETPVQVTIKPCEIALPTEADLVAATYNGSEQTASLKESYADRDKVEFTAGQVQTNAGSHSVTLQPVNSNYIWPNAQTTCTLNWTIAPKTIGIDWGSSTLTYNGSQQAPTATATGLVGEEDTCTITVTGGQTNAGENYTATATAVDNSNYTLPDSGTTQTFTISPKAVTVTIAAKSSAYGAAIVPLTATDNGIVSGDTGVYTLTTFAASASPVGSYDITGTSNSTNYTFTFTGGTKAYTITAASLSAAVIMDDWTYGDTAKEPVVSGNTENGDVTYRYKVKDAIGYLTGKPTEAGSYTVEATIAATANYQKTVVSDDFTIAPKALTVTDLTATNRVYNGTKDVTLTGGALNGVVSGDENDVSATMPDTGTMESADAGNGKAVTFAAIILTGDKAGNYTVTQPMVTVNISKADPGVGEVSYAGDTLYTTTPLSNITLSRTNGTTAGTLELTANQALTAGTAAYGWTFTPNDSTNYKTVTGTISLTVEVDTLSGISIGDTAPSKTEYKYGETFQTKGLTVTATYASDNTRDVTDQVTFGALAVGDTSIELSYQGKTCTVSGLTVSKADAPTLAYISVSQKYTVTTQQSKEIGSAGMPADAGTLTYDKGTETTTGTVTVTRWDVNSTGEVTFTLSGGTVNDTVTLPIEITSTNYADSTVNVKITLTDKDTPTETANDITVTYTGSAVPNSAITGTASVAGSWSFKASAPVTVADSSDSVTVVFTPTDDLNYTTVEDIIQVTINKATPTGRPAYTAITTGGKTLADADLAVGSITPDGGSIAWDLGDSQTVSANTAYKWTYTPADTDNYNELTGSITPYVVSSSGSSSSTPTYPPVVEQPDEGGSVTVLPKNPEKGDKVTLTPKPEKGYEVEQILVTDKNGKPVEVKDNGDGTFSFIQPAGKVTVEVSFTEKEDSRNPFVDVPSGAYYETAVLWAAENGITGGTDATHFSPNAPCTRAQIVTFLWRAAGCPEPETVSSFADVPADSYYAKAVAWAVENGITTGTGDGTTFNPNATCTRAQAMAFIYRSEQARGGGMQGQWMFRNPFDDVNLESYYGEAVMWAVANGVTGGTTATTFNPNANCTRAQIVTFLYRNAK